MDNNNGRGIFYGVIGVATLVVAMIGATFAYFSASISTAENALGATAANITLELSNQVTTGIKSNLIPVDETNDGFADNTYVGILPGDTDTPADGVNNPKAKNCIDDDGNEFCSVYTFTIKNPSTTTAQRVYAEMDVITNTFATNAKKTGEDDCKSYLEKTGEDATYCEKSNFAFAIFKGTVDDVYSYNDDGWNVDGTATTTYYSDADLATTAGVTAYSPTDLNAATNKTESVIEATGVTGKGADLVGTFTGNVAGTAVLGKLGDMVVARTAVPTLSEGATHNFRLAALDQTLRPGGEVTYTVVMWLHENWENQEADETKAFAAGITFSTSLGGSGVTAVLSSAG